MKKDDKKEKLFTYEQEINLEQFKDYIKVYPIVFWNDFIIILMIILFFVLIFGIIDDTSILGVVGNFFGWFILCLVIRLSKKEKIIAQKYKDQEKNTRDKKYTLDFYKYYFIRTSENITRKIFYCDVKKIIESNMYFYLTDNISILSIKKDKMTDEAKEFIRSINKDVYVNKKIKNELSPRIINKILLIIFVLSILSILYYIYNFDDTKYNVVKDSWHLIILSILPLLSLILGIIYINRGKEYKAKKNIVGGIIALLLICIFATDTFNAAVPQSYKNIFKYEEIVSIKLPEKGKFVEDVSFNQNAYMKDFKTYKVYFDNKNSYKIDEEIKNSKNWIYNSDLKSSLNIFISDMFYSNTKSYYLIYNVDLKQYNSLPDKSGKYKYYVMIFNTGNKILEINEFTYIFKE